MKCYVDIFEEKLQLIDTIFKFLQDHFEDIAWEGRGMRDFFKIYYKSWLWKIKLNFSKSCFKNVKAVEKWLKEEEEKY